VNTVMNSEPLLFHLMRGGGGFVEALLAVQERPCACEIIGALSYLFRPALRHPEQLTARHIPQSGSVTSASSLALIRIGEEGLL
jgi:hypothetical protein